MATATKSFEKTTCSRCGGTGEYSYCQMWGTRCFKCHGNREVFTKRGDEANRYFTELLSKRVDEIEVGDAVRITTDGTGKFYRVTQVGIGIDGCRYMDKTSGEWREYYGVKCDSAHYCANYIDTSVLVRVYHTPAEKAEKFAEAMAYQETLTKAGKPRKR